MHFETPSCSVKVAQQSTSPPSLVLDPNPLIFTLITEITLLMSIFLITNENGLGSETIFQTHLVSRLSFLENYTVFTSEVLSSKVLFPEQSRLACSYSRLSVESRRKMESVENEKDGKPCISCTVEVLPGDGDLLY